MLPMSFLASSFLRSGLAVGSDRSAVPCFSLYQVFFNSLIGAVFITGLIVLNLRFVNRCYFGDIWLEQHESRSFHLQVRLRAGLGHLLQQNLSVRKRLILHQLRDVGFRLLARDCRGFATYFTTLIEQQSGDYRALEGRNSELGIRMAELEKENAHLIRNLRVHEIIAHNPGNFN